MVICFVDDFLLGVVKSKALYYRSDAADEVRMFFGHWSQVNNHSTVIVLSRQKNCQKAFSPHLHHLTLYVYCIAM